MKRRRKNIPQPAWRADGDPRPPGAALAALEAKPLPNCCVKHFACAIEYLSALRRPPGTCIACGQPAQMRRRWPFTLTPEEDVVLRTCSDKVDVVLYPEWCQRCAGRGPDVLSAEVQTKLDGGLLQGLVLQSTLDAWHGTQTVMTRVARGREAGREAPEPGLQSLLLGDHLLDAWPDRPSGCPRCQRDFDLLRLDLAQPGHRCLLCSRQDVVQAGLWSGSQGVFEGHTVLYFLCPACFALEQGELARLVNGQIARRLVGNRN